MQGLLERLVVTGVALFALLGIAACDDSVRPATSGSGGGPGAGSGGDGGSPGTTGDGGSPGGGGSGVAGSGGSAGANGAGAGGDGGFAGTTLTTDPWPTSCVPEANLPRPAGESLLTGPAGSSGFGEPAQPGETMTATLNGFPRAWTRFEMTASGFTGYSYDGSLAFTLPSLAPGTYSCPAAALDWANLNAGGRDSNSAWTMACCTIQITTGGGAIGDPIEGTFSGILVHVPLNSWIKVEDGHFRIFQRSPGTGGFTGNTGP